MICFVHVGFDPEPHEADSPTEAIQYTEKRLLAENEDLDPGDCPLNVRWRRDDLYPDNFLEYKVSEVAAYLEEKGEAILQLAATGEDGLPIMGEIANIFTAAEEKKNTKEADEALNALGASLAASYKTPVTLTAAGHSRRFEPGSTTPVLSSVSRPKTKPKAKAKKPPAKTVKAATPAAKKRLKRRTNPVKKKK